MRLHDQAPGKPYAIHPGSRLLPFCSSAGCFLKPHKIDIQQGNFIDQEAVSKLKPEMTRSQVRFLLGTPLITDPFHPERWDYLYIDRKGGKLKEKKRLTLIFDGDKLKRAVTDVPVPEAMTQPDQAAENPPLTLEPRWRFSRSQSPARPGAWAVHCSRRCFNLPILSCMPRSSTPTARSSDATPASLPARRAACRSALTCSKRSPARTRLIDFTRPEGTLAHLAACRQLGVNMVIGTTGLSAEQKSRDHRRPRIASRS